jgi:hypothetical protein
MQANPGRNGLSSAVVLSSVQQAVTLDMSSKCSSHVHSVEKVRGNHGVDPTGRLWPLVVLDGLHIFHAWKVPQGRGCVGDLAVTAHRRSVRGDLRDQDNLTAHRLHGRV